jgi:glyoxylase-like metal-dependent hydrolase (beta-lactamase superfamily II)
MQREAPSLTTPSELLCLDRNLRYSPHPAPGYSIGHMSISMQSDGAAALFTGDVIHTPIQAYKPNLGTVFCADLPLARGSRL